MSKEELLKKYHEIFGLDAPEPPDHLLPVIIEMSESGKLRVILNEHGDEINKLTKELGDVEPDKNDPIWNQIKPDD